MEKQAAFLRSKKFFEKINYKTESPKGVSQWEQVKGLKPLLKECFSSLHFDN